METYNYNVADYIICTAAFMAGTIMFGMMLLVVIGLW